MSKFKSYFNKDISFEKTNFNENKIKIIANNLNSINLFKNYASSNNKLSNNTNYTDLKEKINILNLKLNIKKEKIKSLKSKLSSKDLEINKLLKSNEIMKNNINNLSLNIIPEPQLKLHNRVSIINKEDTFNLISEDILLNNNQNDINLYTENKKLKNVLKEMKQKFEKIKLINLEVLDKIKKELNKRNIYSEDNNKKFDFINKNLNYFRSEISKFI